MRYLFVIILSAFLVAVSSAQVDTLQLVEIGSIQAPSEITELYVENLDGDSLKEIIICTDCYVYIYNSQTYQVEWTSPPLNRPMNLLYEDINGDGLIDFSVQDSSNIYLFDPHTPQTIWISPPLDNTYKCYTMGDRNDDDWIDVAIVKKEPFTRYNEPDNMDTVWVQAYDGPTFTEQIEFISLLPNYSYFWNYNFWYFEVPKSISVGYISGSDGTEPRISIFSNHEEGYTSPYPNHHYCYINSGRLRIFDSYDFGDSLLAAYIGQLLYYNYQESGDTVCLNAITCYRDSTWDYPWGYGWKIFTFFADSVIYSADIYEWWASTWPDTICWNGFIVSDLSDTNNGLENCYSSEDSLVLLRFPEVDTLWMREVSNIDSVLHRFADSSLYGSPQVICAMEDPLTEFQFYSGFDGSLSAVLPDSGYELSKISDLDNDQSDEILSIQGTSLYIYNLDYATGIGDNSKLPYRAFLRSNYPNPFNSSTTIEYGLPDAGQVRIDIYDLLGRKVETLVDEEKQAGQHQVVWDASGYSSGVYFYHIEASDFVDTKRMVYLK